MKRLSVTTVAGSVSGLARSIDVEQRWAEGNGNIFKSDPALGIVLKNVVSSTGLPLTLTPRQALIR